MNLDEQVRRTKMNEFALGDLAIVRFFEFQKYQWANSPLIIAAASFTRMVKGDDAQS